MSHLQDLIAGLPMPVLATDHEIRIIAANNAAQKLLGQDLINRPFVTVLRHPRLIDALDEIINSGTAANKTDWHRNHLVISALGRDIPVEITLTGLPEQLGALVVIEDSIRTEDAAQMRRDFIANVSHELRTPLTAMMGFIETLLGPANGDPVARNRFLSIMQTEAVRMNRLVMDLLSLSRVEAEEYRQPAERVNIAHLIQAVADALAPAATRYGARIEIKGKTSEADVAGDPDQLRQVFYNLVENAMKYGRAGGTVTLCLDPVRYEASLRIRACSIRVIDEGDGIEDIHLPRLTERFYRADNHRAREHGGSGLGLAIVKHIVSRHRGKLRIESCVGKGSCFTVLLPVLSE